MNPMARVKIMLATMPEVVAWPWRYKLVRGIGLLVVISWKLLF